MTGKRGLTQDHAARMLGARSLEDAPGALKPDLENLPAVPAGTAKVSEERAMAFWEETGGDPALREILLHGADDDLSRYQGNIENFIGLMRMPLGLAGPLRVNGLAAKGDYWIPLATTEAALVASYHRGCRVLTAAGGCSAMVLYESLSRAPAFVFETAGDACRFVVWALARFEEFQKIAGHHHLPRQARRCRLHGGGQPRLSEFRVHHRRRVRPEHGHPRDPGDVR